MEFKIIHIPETDSTNRYLRELKAEGDVLVQTDYQTAGRGCGTNRWESERGQNLLFSLLIHPKQVPASKQFLISMVTANSISKVVSKYVENVSVKWPNDIYVGDRKICGILIQNTLQGGT
ncbi:MAG: biotin--[acetyl-CoA-carboxylase] ligase, partial [Prevotella sp.]|nr:biotin--[acetyl-CoA-carboxylase] ligase [Prevotella sp.]